MSGVQIPPGAPIAMHEIIKQHFLGTVSRAGHKYDYLLRHLPLVEKWANKLCALYPNANKNVVLGGVWLHDIGQVVGDENVDHAVNSEREAISYLRGLNINAETVEKVAHCARSHRCKDVQPNTLEAKIVAVADSASHMTDIVYIDMSNRGEVEKVKGKLERDYRDTGLFPELQSLVKPLYIAWKNLLDIYPREI